MKNNLHEYTTERRKIVESYPNIIYINELNKFTVLCEDFIYYTKKDKLNYLENVACPFCDNKIIKKSKDIVFQKDSRRTYSLFCSIKCCGIYNVKK